MSPRSETEEWKGVARALAQSVIRLASEIRKACPSDRLVARWIEDAERAAFRALKEAQRQPKKKRSTPL